jgi:hypothetical protein
MIFDNLPGIKPYTGWLLILLFLNGCNSTKQVIVQGNFPSPLVSKIPVSLGVWYGDDFANHEIFDESRSRAESDWIVKTGQAQVQMWDTLLAGMFENLVHLEARPAAGSDIQGVDMVLIPHVEELQYAIPTQTHIKVYEIWMRYRFELVTGNGEPIAEWTMTSYGKTPTAFMRSDEAAVNLAAVMALRDAGANFVVSFPRVPDVQQWLQQGRGGPEEADHE